MKQKLIGELVFLLFILGAFGQKLTSSKSFISKKSQLQHDFQKFKKTYGKSYDSDEHESYRFNVFVENIKEADALNNQSTSAKFGITQFTDITKEEFLNIYANSKISTEDSFDSYLQNTSSTDIQVENQIDPPQTWDIRINGPGKLQPIVNQGGCGSCWAFAVTTAVENQYSINQNLNINLSEQQQVDCVYKRDGCQGGWFPDAYNYVQKIGLTTEDKYPYTGQYGQCRAQQMNQFYKISGFVNLPNDHSAIKQALVSKGAVSVGVDCRLWAQYTSGIFDIDPIYPELNKAATIIGYGPNYWLIRNTWGTAWGEQGHIRIANQKRNTVLTKYSFQPYL
ncbi:hypothetical protein ABPG74_018395 [Tetrahymena malaccensis]